ncbi:hypothetical protein A2U01_0015216, partial [Trifolium medium]|nr:hypothetical protein [Trifolium medium]
RAIEASAKQKSVMTPAEAGSLGLTSRSQMDRVVGYNKARFWARAGRV